MTAVPPATRADAPVPRRERVAGAARLGVRAGPPAGALGALYQSGSARIRLPGHDDDRLQAVLMNTAGGLTGDDRLDWDVTLGAGAKASVTTAAAEKLYRSHGPPAKVHTRLLLESGAELEWLPQESIVFDGSALERRIEADLAPGAMLLLVESFVFGRQAMGERPRHVDVQDRWTICRAGALLHLEALRLQADHAMLAPRRGILHGFGAIATVLLCDDRGPLRLAGLRARVDAVLDAIPQARDMTVRRGSSVLPGRLLLRFAAVDSLHLRRYLIPCIRTLAGRGHASLPRVWLT